MQIGRDTEVYAFGHISQRSPGVGGWAGEFGVSRGGTDTFGSNCGDNDGDDDIAIVLADWFAVYASGTLHHLLVVAAAPAVATM